MGILTQPLDVLALLALTSLFVASARYPVVAVVGSAEIRLQDVLFGALVVGSASRLARWAARRPGLAAALGLFLVCIAVSAVRSPIGGTAVVAVAKYTEFVLAGLAVGLVLREYGRPELVTVLLASGTALTALAASVDLVLADGLRALAADRSGGLLSMEGATAAGAVTAVWCAVRLTRLNGPVEGRFAVIGLASAGAVLLLAKSVLSVGAGIALLALIPVFGTRWFWRAAAALALVLVIAAVGRASDIKSATGVEAARSGTKTALAVPRPGAPPSLPMPFTRQEPQRVTGGSFVHRVALAYLGLRIASEAPAFGHGWLTTSDASFLRSGPYDLYMLERFPGLDPVLLISNYPSHSHNAYIQAFSEAGPLAAILLVSVLLLTIVPGVVLVRRQRSVTPWPAACGLGWVIVIAVFLASSALFGGQSETCLLGASLALCDKPVREPVGRRAWALGVMATLVLVAAFVAVVMLPRGDGETTPVARVALVDEGGNETFRSGTVLSEPSRWRLVNGLARARIEGDQIMLRTTEVAGRPATAERPVAQVAALSQVRRAIVAQRYADAVSVDLFDARDRRIARLTMVRGVPGVYVALGTSASIAIPEPRGLALGSDFGYAKSPIIGRSARAISAGSPVLVTDTHNAHILVPLNAARVSASSVEVRLDVASRKATFLSLHSLERSATALTPGAYAVRPAEGAGPMRIQQVQRGSSRAWAVGPSMIAPYVLDNGQRSGIARSISLGVIYRAAALG
jgi:hypothetical protein